MGVVSHFLFFYLKKSFSLCQALVTFIHLSFVSSSLLKRIRVVVQIFLQLPFWVRKFHLARIKPTTLQVSLCEETAKLM